MADIRINSLPTTASASSSDDFLALDGATNGTRKLNAYSPTFGGNLTVTGTSALGDATGGVFYQASLNSNNQGTGVRLLNNNAGSRNWYIGSQNNVGNAVEITPSTANNGTTFSTPVWQISSAGNVTQTGNLTVSGTGTSSVAGSLQANGGTAQSVNTPALRIGNDKILVWLDSSSTTTNAGFLWYDSSNILRIGAENGTRIQVAAATTTISNNLTVSGTALDLTNSNNGQTGLTVTNSNGGTSTYTKLGTWNGTVGVNLVTWGSAYTGRANESWLYTNGLHPLKFGTDSTARMTLTSTGNFLLGTTTDSGNGKLQLADHTTSAGGIGFGTTTSLYRYGITTLGLQQNNGSYKPLFFYADVTNCGVFDTPAAEPNYSGIYFNSTANTATIATKGTVALTLDNAQNAIFAGKTYNIAGTAVAPSISFNADNDSGFYNPGGNQVSLACGGGQIWNTTVNGLSMASGKDIYLGNAYVAGAPTATGYVTIKDSAGTVYKVLVGT